MNANDRLKSIEWNIMDAMEALMNAVGMGDWNGVIKYVHQIKELEYQKYLLKPPSHQITA